MPIVTPEGQISSYVVNVGGGRTPEPGSPGDRRGRRHVVQEWPQIGVFVVHSTSGDFRTDVVARAAVAPSRPSAPTRTTAVVGGHARHRRRPARTARSARAGVQKDEFANTAAEDVVADPREAEQWDMQVIKADQAHQVTDGSSDVLVGVLDSGIDPDHPDLAANIDTADSVNCTDAGRVDTSATGWHPTTSDHGTHVAGTIAAARNGEGIVGVAPDARLASVKVVSDQGYIYPEFAICGFMWAGLKGMDVTNNSYFIDPFMYWCGDQPDQAAAMEAVNRAVQWSTGRASCTRRPRATPHRPVEQHDRHHQPERQPAGQPHASTAAASTSRPSCRAS